MSRQCLLALRETALLLGGQRELAGFLGIDEWLVARWLEGLGHPPDFICLRCTEHLESHKQAAAATDARNHGLPGHP